MKFYFVLFCMSVYVDTSIQDVVGESDSLLRNTDGANYLLVGPGTLLAGASNRLCFSRLGRATEGAAQLQLDIQADGNTTQHVARLRKNFPQGYGGCFDMVVPKTLHAKVALHLRIRFDAIQSYEVNRYWRGVRILPISGVVTVQMDKPMYRPGETVKFRILHLRPDLLPVHTPIRRVWVEMPGALFGGRARAAQWERVRTQLGLTQLEYALDQYAPKGDWSIHVETDDTGSEAAAETFTVADFTLPTFYLTVKHPAKLLRTTPRITWTVCVRHMWGEVVRGALTLRVHGDGGAAPVRLSARLYSEPCHNHTIDSRKLDFNAAGSDAPTLLVADISFQEESTRIWKNTSVISKLVEDTPKIEFINKNKMFVSPGLPYKIKMKVLDWSDEPLAGAAVKVCRTATNSSTHERDENSIDGAGAESCDTVYRTDSKGYLQASFSVPIDLAAKFYNIQATVRSTHALLTLVVRGGDKIHAALGALGSGSRNYVPLYISYPPNVEITAPTFHFMLVTRGGNIFRWGATTQCPQLPTSSLSVRQTVQPLTRCFTSAPSRRLFRLALPARVSHQMCPYSHMLVYFYQDGDLVLATKHFKVSECFYNKVMTRWSPSEVSPGNSTRLIITTLGPALCATSVRDVALRHTLPSHVAPPSLHTHLLNKLRVFMETRKNITLRDLPQRSCFRENGISDSSAQDYEYLLSTFSTSGMRITSDLLPDLDCTSDQPEPLEQPPRPAPYERTYFPDSWLWKLQLLSANGTLELDVRAPDAVTEYETSVSCVSRSGVSVAPVAVLKVFQPFFVELETPRKIKRGEQTQFFYKIYNYIDESIAVTVDIETDDDSGISIRGAKGKEPSSHNICLGVNDVYSVRLGVVGTSIGSWKIAVKAEVLPQMQHYCNSNFAGIFPSDKIMKKVVVVSEGELTERHRSSMLCTDGDGRYASELVWPWEGNERTVSGTERWLLWIIGDLAGPLDVNADKLLSLPLGCGEQNMARLAHNLVALRHMELRGHVSHELKDKALANIMSGYARQIRYLHPSGGFSAFGPKDETASSWLTAFCLRYLHAARRRLPVEGPTPGLAAAEDWLISLQMENGCFQNVGQVFHREFKGGLDSEQSNIALTAYILISIIEAGTVLRPAVVQNAAYCLEALYRSPDPVNAYTLALVAYAQTRLETYESEIQHRNDINLKTEPINRNKFGKEFNGELINNNTKLSEITANREGRKDEAVDVVHAVSRLRGMAKRSGDLVWWETDSLATSIESTAYAVLALLAAYKSRSKQQGSVRVEQAIELDDANGAIRWLSLHRNSAGGFLSTQDTLVALEAIAAWSSFTSHPPSNLVVTVSGPGLSQAMEITPRTRHELHSMVAQAERGERTVRVRVQGTGCILVQATQQYNSLEPAARFASPFSLHASVKTDGLFDCQNNSSWCRCAAILEVCISWMGKDFPEMAIVEVDLPTGYVTDKTLLYKLLDGENTLLRRLEEWEVDSKVVLYLAMEGSYRGGRPRECYNLYLIGPQSKTAPTLVQVYDYYHREVNASQRYIISENCPGPVAHTESSYIGLSNTFAQYDRARSIDNETEDIEQNSAEVYPYSLPDSGSQEIYESVGLSTVIAAPSYENPPKGIILEDKENIEDVKNVNMNSVETSTHTQIRLDNTTNEKIEQITSENPISVLNVEASETTSTSEMTTLKPFSNFHEVDSEMDLEVPEGIEGPVPHIVAPPPGFFWSPEPQSSEEYLPEEPLVTILDNPERFTNWTVVTHDLLAEDK